MSTALVIVAVDEKATSKSKKADRGTAQRLSVAGRLVRVAQDYDIDETIVVVSSPDDAVPQLGDATVIVDEAVEQSQSSALRAAVDFCARLEHDAVIVASTSFIASSLVKGEGWQTLLEARPFPIVLLTEGEKFAGMARVEETAWPMLALDGTLESTWRAHPELTVSIEVGEKPLQAKSDSLDCAPESYQSADLENAPLYYDATDDDKVLVAGLLGRNPTGQFRVVVRGRDGVPVVIENAPFLDDGTPMPTRYWLVGAKERHAVGQLESTGGNQAAEDAIDAEVIAECHRRHAEGRDALIPSSYEGPRPSGGVGGTRVGVKCLHAHLANYLAGEADPVGRWVVAKSGHQFGGPVAAIDCGTNSTRLLILDRNGEPIDRQMTITRLGRGVDQTSELATDAIERTVAAIASYREALDTHGVVSVRAVATSAARDARNRDEFFDAAAKVLGVELELLAGEEEGRLSYRGATVGLEKKDGPYLIVDIGGGSTELVAGKEAMDDLAVTSLAMGCVRISERFLASDPIGDREMQQASEYISSTLNNAVTTIPELLAPQRLIGVAGTVATLATLDAALDHYDPKIVHHRELSRDTVEQWLEKLADETVAQRREHPGIEAGRADVLVGGVLVLAEVMAVCGQEKVMFSERDILDGIAEDLFERVNPAI